MTTLAAAGAILVVATVCLGCARGTSSPSAASNDSKIAAERSLLPLSAAATKLDGDAEIKHPQSILADVTTAPLYIRLLTTLSVIELELAILEATLNLDDHRRPRRWPLTIESLDSLRRTDRLLGSHERELQNVRSTIESFATSSAQKALLTSMDQVHEDLAQVGISISYLFIALRNDSESHVFPPTNPARTSISTLQHTAMALLPTWLINSHAGRMAWSVSSGLDHLRRGIAESCFAMNCGGDDRYGEPTTSARIALRYTTAELEVTTHQVLRTARDRIDRDRPGCFVPISFALQGVIWGWLATAWQQQTEWQDGEWNTAQQKKRIQLFDTHPQQGSEVFRQGLVTCLALGEGGE